MRAITIACLCLVAAACGPGKRNEANCTSICSSFGFQQCHEDGSFDPPVACRSDEICDPVHGCVVCVPDQLYCSGDSVHRCNGAGTGGTLVEDCAGDLVCSSGACKTPCEAALDKPSNVGCDFWAADLDNESANLGGVTSDAAAQQLAIIVANNNDYPITVTVTKNAARVGQPIDEQVVLSTNVAARVSQRIDLPQREVDGAMGQNGAYAANSGSGTFVSPHAYHVVTSGPAVVYQFNPIVQQFSNDASTLIPIQALGTDYIGVGFQTANPCGIAALPQPSVPDHGAIAILAPHDGTTVTVTPSHPIMASGGDSGFPIAETPAGGTLTFTMGRYTVVNLETRQPVGDVSTCANAVNAGADGDLTGTYVKADKPIVVFMANERGLGFGGAPNIDYPPGWDPQNGDDICCTEHMEEQLLPVTALGREFAIARSPVRSTHATWVEQDIFRVVGSADGTTVTTNLPPPHDRITVNAREEKTFMAGRGFTLSADKAVQVAQYLVPQHFVKEGYIGDPSQLTIPAAEQHRKDYVFLVPATWTKNYAVFARPVAARIELDGKPLDGVEFGSCARAPIGILAGTDYEQVTCLLAAGRHQATGDQPFGLSVFGYHSVGAYSFVGGSDVKLINPIY